jgi:carotenoid cleavage dioxygenase-like enzyme
MRIESQLDITGHNEWSVYNVAGYKPIKIELSHVPVTGKIPGDLIGVYLRRHEHAV